MRTKAAALLRRRLDSERRADFRSHVEGYHAAPLDRASEHALSTAGDDPPEPGENDLPGLDTVPADLRRPHREPQALGSGGYHRGRRGGPESAD